MRLIDADEIKGKSRKCFVDGFHGSGIYGEMDVVLTSDIENATAVDAAPVVHGRWCFMGTWEECSICGHAIAVDDPHTNYCPNCGAKMDLKG